MKYLHLIFFLLLLVPAAGQSLLIPTAHISRQLYEPASLETTALDRITGGLAWWLPMRPGILSVEAFYNRNAQEIALPGEVTATAEWEYLTLAAAYRLRLPVPDPDAGSVTVGPILYTSYLLDDPAGGPRWDHGAGLALAFQAGLHIEFNYLHGLLGVSERTRHQQVILKVGVPIGL